MPAFLPPLPEGGPANRLTFARWLVSRDNPLTARVQVNRQWAAFFGRGFVRTVQDFGYQGELPSNQPLLDWLAVQFMKDGWSFKKLDRLIVTSATYRQTSNVTPDLIARDPDNILLARGPRFRAEAEIVRDSALQSSGLLSERIGGPSVFPPQPASVTTEGAYGALKWKTSTGDDRYRRSLYTFSKRTAPFALYNGRSMRRSAERFAWLAGKFPTARSRRSRFSTTPSLWNAAGIWAERCARIRRYPEDQTRPGPGHLPQVSRAGAGFARSWRC